MPDVVGFRAEMGGIIPSTNLSMVRLAADAEGWLGKPIIAINTATLWHAYRMNGFMDKLYGFGSLLSEH